MDYIKDLCIGSTTVLRAKGELSRKIKENRGIRRGGPAIGTPVLGLMEWAVSGLDEIWQPI